MNNKDMPSTLYFFSFSFLNLMADYKILFASGAYEATWASYSNKHDWTPIEKTYDWRILRNGRDKYILENLFACTGNLFTYLSKSAYLRRCCTHCSRAKQKAASHFIIFYASTILSVHLIDHSTPSFKRNLKTLQTFPVLIL